MADEHELEQDDIEIPDLDDVLDALADEVQAEGVFVMTGAGRILGSAGDVGRAVKVPLTNADDTMAEDDWDGHTAVFNTTAAVPEAPALSLTTVPAEGGWYLVGVVFDRAATRVETIRFALRQYVEDLIPALEEADESAGMTAGAPKTTDAIAEIVDRGLTQIIFRHVGEAYVTRLESILDHIDALAKDPADPNYVEDYLPELAAAVDSFQHEVSADDAAVLDAAADLSSYTTSLTPDAIAKSGLAPLRIRVRTLLDACVSG